LRVAVVHTTELYSNIFGLPAAALASVPVRVANRREINPDKSPAQIAAQRAAYACAHKVVANSRAAADRLAAEGVPVRKIAVVSNGLELSQFVPRQRGLRGARPDAGPDVPRRKVVVVANLRSEKGHEVLVDAAALVLPTFPDARFEIVGAGPELEPIRARAEARGVSRALAFLGHRDDVAARLAAADLFVLPSRSEAFPNAVLEAMAAGLPIVASGVGGILELIDHERTGLLCPAGDPAALGAAIARLMSDAPLAARLGEAARSEAAARYSFDRMVAAFDAIYVAELTRRGVIRASEPQLVAS
jgi:glycosyltransferase involved in cell wall biosynthesis